MELGQSRAREQASGSRFVRGPGHIVWCLADTHTVLIHDSTRNRSDNGPYYYSDTVEAESRTHVATKLTDQLVLEYSHPEIAFCSFVGNLKDALTIYISHPIVIRFKSSVCYWTGLGIRQNEDECQSFIAF
jgi:hypothetical protein